MTTPEVRAPWLPWSAADPYPYYERCRRRGDVVWDDTAHAWLVVGYDAARDVLTGPHWSSDPRAAGATSPLFDSVIVESNMLLTDGRRHDRLRAAVRDVFGRTFVDGLTAGVEAICADVVGAVPAGEPFDFMSQVALRVPVAVIGAWLGLDADQCRALQEHSPAIIRVLGGFAGDAELDAGLAASAALIADFLPAAADRRTHPRDDLLSFLAADGDLTLDEVVVTAILVAVAGHETTANLLGAALLRLITVRPDGTRLADEVSPQEPATITELMRLDAPVQATARTATRDQLIGDAEIRCGDSVLVAIAAANRDPGVFTQPDLYYPRRTGPAPLTFGLGAHYCLGAPLARIEVAAALRDVLARRPVLAGAPAWRDTPAVRGPSLLPVSFTRGKEGRCASS